MIHHVKELFLIAVGVLGLLCWGSHSVPLQKLWWVCFGGAWVVANFITGSTNPPLLFAWNTCLDLTLMSAAFAILRGNGFRNTLYMMTMGYVMMLTVHFSWAFYQIADDYAYKFILNALFLVTILAVGGRCVPLVYGRFRDNGGWPFNRPHLGFGGGK